MVLRKVVASGRGGGARSPCCNYFPLWDMCDDLVSFFLSRSLIAPPNYLLVLLHQKNQTTDTSGLSYFSLFIIFC